MISPVSRLDRYWNRWLLRRIGWLLLAKFTALMLLSLFFFGPEHRPGVDGEVIHRVIFQGSFQHTDE